MDKDMASAAITARQADLKEFKQNNDDKKWITGIIDSEIYPDFLIIHIVWSSLPMGLP